MPDLHVMLNNRSGSARLDGDDLARRLAAAGYPAVVDDDDHLPFATRLRALRRSDADLLVAAGGDGTVTAVAEAALETGRPLAILPMGTANLLARDLQLPLELEGWIAALPGFVERRIDIGRVNGRAFLHKVVIGFVPGIAAGRERIRGETALGARLAFLGYAARRILRARRVALEVTRDAEAPHIDRVQAVAIANNAYDESFGRFFARSRLDAGELAVYKLHSVSLLHAIRLATGVFLGRWQDDDALTIESAGEVLIRAHRRQFKVMRDGEVETLKGPLRFSIEPRALRVLAPPLAPAPGATVAEETAA